MSEKLIKYSNQLDVKDWKILFLKSIKLMSEETKITIHKHRTFK